MMNDQPDKSPIAVAAAAIPDNELKRYNITVQGRRTSVTLEPHTWETLNNICAQDGIRMNDLFDMMAATKEKAASMSSTIRVFLIAYLYAQTAPLREDDTPTHEPPLHEKKSIGEGDSIHL